MQNDEWDAFMSAMMSDDEGKEEEIAEEIEEEEKLNKLRRYDY